MADRRLSAADRRNRLLAVGADLFATQSYEDVRMQQVADAAGISRALLYRHFPTKRDLFAAVYRNAADGLLAITELDADVPMADQVAAGLDAHLDYFVANRNTVLAANRSLAGDPVVQAVIADELEVLRARMLDTFTIPGASRATVSAVVMSWLVFVRTLCVEWLARGDATRDEIRDVCGGALLGALTPLARVETARP
jgi:AcrR family transcriptional regulator